MKSPALDEALQTKFICSVDNEAISKTLFKIHQSGSRSGRSGQGSQSPKLPKRKKRKPPASGVEVLFHPSIEIKFEIDIGASDTFCCKATWQYQVAEGSPLPVVGQFQSTASIDEKSPDVTFPVIVTKVPNLSCAESTTTIEHVTTNDR